MNLLLLEPGELGPDGRVELADRRAVHAREVLGARPGTRLRAGLLAGPLGEAEVLSDDGRRLVLRFRAGAPPPPRPAVDVLLALPRPKVLRRLLAPLAALGVGRLMLTNAWKVERDYFDTHVLGAAALGAELRLGLEQAQDTWLPEVSVHKHLRALLEDELDGLCPGALRLVADPSGRERLHAATAAGAAARLVLAVGPEGGWIERELELLARHGFRLVGLGPRPLRTDVACLALVALAHDALAAR
ncbi:MAG TPA: RsmE family RNA methyltransferase [Myxococcota bacterium]|nr:RsmE family RNA methyltransferase [Myxococcota bacterium]HRY93342.1 RsmE family RNA methyltransferase [Myxococcota bacterium]HSA21057.1 RsmE family RNA methyltransferase [Myxococcota bacterium]